MLIDRSENSELFRAPLFCRFYDRKSYRQRMTSNLGANARICLELVLEKVD